jgi:tripartite-type tricarboxylate transporter receptor subunit TctC
MKETRMNKRFFFKQSALALGLLTLGGFQGAMAQAFPTKNVTVVVPFPPGGGPDLMARVFAEKLAAKWGKPVVVENRPGAGALLGAQAVAKAPADGHTLLLTTNTMVISPHVLAPGAGGGVDVHADLMPVVAPATTPMAMLANAGLGVKDLKEAIALANKQTGMPYGSAGNGSPMHFAGEMLKRAAGVDMLHVPYKGVAPSVMAAVGGEVKFLFVGLGGALPHIKSGKLVPLAVTEKNRSPLLPEVPTASEQGVRGVEVNAWYGVFAPTGTPNAVRAQINADINEVLKLSDVRDKLTTAGLDVLGGSDQVLGDFMKADRQRYGQLAKALNIKAD